MKVNRALAKAVQTRLNAGERKEQIYSALKEKYSAASVERSLAQWPYPADKEKNRFLNVPLLIIIITFTLMQILQISAVLQTLEPSGMALATLIVIIYLYTIYGVFNGNLIGYTLAVLVGLMAFNQAGLTLSRPIPLALGAAAIVLAVIQKRKLFPNTSWLLRHKKDSAGNIIF